MMDNTALFKVEYGLYILTANTNGKDNGCVNNTFMQVTHSPLCGVVAVNKQNHTHDMIMSSKKVNISILTTDAPFSLFEHFGFQSGKTVDKFAGFEQASRSENGLLYLTQHCGAYLSLDVTETFDLDTHTLFRGNIVDARNISSADIASYSYYHRHIKPKPGAPAPAKTGYRCTVCNYIYAGEPLPADYICPVCKYPASSFVKI